jgi:putative tryptophan/tyrosine transport system substrate-binding protein
LPAIYPASSYIDAGGLLAYALDYNSIYAQLAHQAGQIFKGAKPGDIPIQQVTKYRLVINLKTAQGLGLMIPQPLLARADQVIE